MKTSLMTAFILVAVWLLVMLILAIFARGKSFQISSLTKGLAGATKTWPKAAGTITIILVFGIVCWFVFRDKSETTTKNRQTTTSATHSRVKPESLADPTRKSLKPGEWSQWVDVSRNILNVWPATAEVEYECKDIHGKIITRPGLSKPGVHSWNDLTEFERVRSKKVEIVYNSVERH